MGGDQPLDGRQIDANHLLPARADPGIDRYPTCSTPLDDPYVQAATCQRFGQPTPTRPQIQTTVVEHPGKQHHRRSLTLTDSGDPKPAPVCDGHCGDLHWLPRMLLADPFSKP
ncbi:hypothetical protein MSHO_08850 [Mycobacterium shottsii]|uniref:Uncharacterized protein n=1 Tax=Mycobacterium shottsii TaxID=133549 RepID=A0A7I7L7A6_9MYCO|nr:hypothetical protein MSHO_08850 [Mycobacterium shottsii]